MSYIGNEPFTAAFLTDTFSGNGSTVAFTMTVAPATTSSIIVAITGVLQDPSTYSVSGTTLTFSAAPPTGTSNISVRYLGIPASGVTTTAYRTVTNTTATAGQTSFTIPSYTVGYVDVYRNGVYLPTADYTATTGTTVVLTNAATLGDTITTISFFVSSVINAVAQTNGSSTSQTLVSPTISGTPVMGASVITSGTAQASTSGTSIDFTSIPSWVKRITVMLNGVSTSGTSFWALRVGTSSGIASTGYAGGAGEIYTVNNILTNSSATEIALQAGTPAAADTYNGIITIVNLSGNIWSYSGNIFRSAGTSRSATTAGTVTLSATLDRVRITTVGGTDTFDAGSINILYE
jgi:hypothetical protein